MRLHAQTGMIDNGFVHLIEEVRFASRRWREKDSNPRSPGHG